MAPETTTTRPPAHHEQAGTFTFTAWVCIDCYYAHHGLDVGPEGLDQDGRELADLLSRLADGPALVTAGLLAAEHDDQCPNVADDGTWLGDDDCWCERQGFSWSRCDGCGSHLGGDREALTVTVWDRDDDGSAAPLALVLALVTAAMAVVPLLAVARHLADTLAALPPV